jgi:hypothetical protein
LTESKDFEVFLQKSILPKELQKVNPALLGIGTESRNINSPMNFNTKREITDEERDIIRMKYKLKKMNTKLGKERENMQRMLTNLSGRKVKFPYIAYFCNINFMSTFLTF